MPLYFDHGCQCWKTRREPALSGFGGTPLPGSILDALYGSLNPLWGRLTEAQVAAQTSWAPDNSKSAWVGNLNQASQMLQNASIEGQLGQRLAMGDVTVAAWRETVNAAADLVEFVLRETGTASYSIRRIWNEIVVPTVTQAGQGILDYGPKAISWAPYVAAGVVGLFLLTRR